MAQKHGFWSFQENRVISFVWTCVKWKFLWFINILKNLHAWEKSGSQAIAKNGSRLMSDFDFWHVDRHE